VPELAACTIVSRNYLAFARVLARSFREHQPHGRFFVLLVDEVDGCFDPAQEPFELIEVSALAPRIPELRAFLFKYTLLEVNTAVKPYLLEHLLEMDGIDRLVYLDPDILVLRPLDALEAMLDSSVIVLTPHLTASLDDGRKPDETAILRSGAYNLGFLGLADRDPVRDFLRWWQRRVFERCVVRVEEGLFVDQKWIDLVPGLFEGVCIVRDPGYNVAYWNLHDRRVSLDHGPECNGEPLYFFHFSGFEVDDVEAVSRHQDRFRLADLGAVGSLFHRYGKLLVDAGYRECSSLPYAYGAFADGTPIPAVARSLYLSLGPAQARFGDPFAVGGESFMAWLAEPVRGRGAGGAYLSRLLHFVHQSRLDLQQNFPDPAGDDLRGLTQWFDVNGRQLYPMDECFLEPLAPLLANRGSGLRTARPLRRGLRRAYDSRVAIRARALTKEWLGERRIQTIKQRLKPALTGQPEVGAMSARPSLPKAELSKVGVNILGYVRTETGVGEAARGLARAVEAAGLPCSLTNIEFNVRARRRDRSLGEILAGPEYGINIFAVNADQVGHVAAHLGLARYSGRHNIGCWSWELDVFPEQWLSSFDLYDEVWAPSRFCAASFAAASPVPVVCIPLSVEIDAPPEGDRSRFGLPADDFVFLFVFDFLSYMERKNPIGLVRAFRRAFGGDPGVRLILKTVNADADTEGVAALRHEMEGASVEIVDGYLERGEVYDLIAACDCYVSLHRSEGFGLTMAEAMALGKTVIATGYSGNMEFMDVNNSLLAHHRLVELEHDLGPYRRGSRWAEPDLEHAAALMRRVVEQPELRRRLGERARADVRAHLGRAAVGAMVRQRIEYILRRNPPGYGLTHPSGREG